MPTLRKELSTLSLAAQRVNKYLSYRLSNGAFLKECRYCQDLWIGTVEPQQRLGVLRREQKQVRTDHQGKIWISKEKILSLALSLTAMVSLYILPPAGAEVH